MFDGGDEGDNNSYYRGGSEDGGCGAGCGMTRRRVAGLIKGLHFAACVSIRPHTLQWVGPGPGPCAHMYRCIETNVCTLAWPTLEAGMHARAMHPSVHSDRWRCTRTAGPACLGHQRRAQASPLARPDYRGRCSGARPSSRGRGGGDRSATGTGTGMGGTRHGAGSPCYGPCSRGGCCGGRACSC